MSPDPRNATHRAAGELARFEAPIPDALLLAAIERAAFHARRDSAIMSRLVPHLGYSPSVRASGHLKRQLASLIADGVVEQMRVKGVVSWRLTSQGHARLVRARRAGEPTVLPESPQHRIWRHSRMIAGEQIDALREQTMLLRDELDRLLTTEPAAGSPAWFDLARRLCTACWALGEATYCSAEWSEPEDVRPAGYYFYVGDALDWLRGASG